MWRLSHGLLQCIPALESTKLRSIKWQGVTAVYFIKQGCCCGHYIALTTAGIPYWHGDLNFSSGLFCSEILLISFYINFHEIPTGYNNIYKLCNQKNHMDCINLCVACSGKKQGLSNNRVWQMRVGKNQDLENNTLWSSCIHHKIGPLLWPVQVLPAGIMLV